jgi:predicted dehydrogenase
MVAGTDPNGQTIKSIKTEKVGDSDLIVVASPGTAHIQAIEQIGAAKGPVLIEKPLCYSDEELAKWLAFGKSRQDPIYVCHNYRFKKNVRAAIDTLAKWNPGELHHVNIHFESPPVSASSSPWMRNERVSRTLLLDFSLHFLDLACMFGRGAWKTDNVRYTLNSAGQTAVIDGHIKCDTYGVSFLLRQGFGPRRARVLMNFQNYSVSLGFFPDTYVTYMSNDNPWLHKYEKKQSMKATVRKIIDKLTNKESDDSHPIALGAALGALPTYEKCIRMETLAPFYTGMFELSRHVYGM